jgi:hypothetical protein
MKTLKLIPIYLLLLLYSCTESPKLNTFVETDKIKVTSTHDTLKVKVTYYYSPIIKVLDYGVGAGTIIHYKGKNIRLYLPDYAPDIISVEGFAILICNTESLKGRYIINSNYEIRPYIEGSEGNKLKIGQLAVDNNLIPHGSNIYIKELNENSQAKDVGNAIKGKHVDYYLGIGEATEMKRKANKMPETLTLIIKKV